MDIDEAKRKHETQLMRLPNVQAVGIGRRDDQEVIKVFVTHKVPEAALQPGEIVPRRLEGYETDVEEIGIVTAQPQ